MSTEENLENVMLRLKTILHGLGDRELYQWIDYEVKGYPGEIEVPEYRKIGITPTISYTDGIRTINRGPAHLGVFSDEELDIILNHTERGGIGSLFDNKDCVVSYDPVITHKFGEGFDRKIAILEAFGKLPINAFAQININVKSKVLDILLDLESRFGNLDDFDVLSNLGEKEKEEAKTIIKNYIQMGDNNVVKGSSLGMEVTGE